MKSSKRVELELEGLQPRQERNACNLVWCGPRGFGRSYQKVWFVLMPILLHFDKKLRQVYDFGFASLRDCEVSLKQF